MIAVIRNVTVILLLSIGFGALAAPTTLTYQGRILKSNGTPLQHNNVSFVFQITDPAGACVIYQEQVDGYDMTNSGGVFDRPIGSGSRSFPASGTFTISDAFNNSAMLSCKGGSTYSPAIADGRKLRVQFYDGSGWNLISPDNVIRSVPYASFADAANKLGSNSAGDFVLKSSVNAGTSCDSGNFVTWDATTQSFGCAAVSGASGGTVTNVTSTNAYLSVANGAATPALTVNVGTTANTVAAGNDARFTDSRPPNGTASGDLGDSYPAPKVVKLQGVDLSATAPTSGQVIKYSGSAWAPSSLAISDITGLSTYLSGTLLQSQFPASCTASQTLTFLSPSGSFSCTNISVSGSNFAAQAANTVFAGPTSGSAAPTFRALEASDLPASISSGLWTSSGADVYRAAGNVGIGTATPGFPLDVAGAINSNYKVEINRDGNSALLLLQSYRAATNHSKVQMRGARGTQASPVTLNSGDILGELRYDSWTSGTNFGNSGNIQVVADDDHSATSTPARMEFYTTAAGATSSTTPAMIISSNAYLGVGTTNPQRRFHVRSDGTYQFRIENASAGGGYWNIGQSDSVFGTGGGKLLFVPNSDASTSATVVFTNSGNVGIGTTSPTTRLEVAGTVKATAFEGPLTASTNSVGAGSNASPSLTFSGDTNTGFYNTSSNDVISVATGGAKIFDFSSTGLASPTSGGALITTTAGSAATPTFSFSGDPDTGWFSPLANTLAAATAGTERVRIDSSGNFGIGTTAPAFALDVAGEGRFKAASGNTDLMLVDSSSTYTWGIFTSTTGLTGFYDYTNNKTPFWIASNAPTNSLQIADTGNVGVGTTSPTFGKVEINSDTGLRSDIHMIGDGSISSDGSIYVLLDADANGTGSSFMVRSESNLALSATELFRVQENGNVGIGTSAPSAMLHVVGNGRSAAPGFLSYFDTDGTNLSLGRYRGTVATPEGLQAGDRIGAVLAGAGTSASTSHNTAAMEFFAEDAYTSTSAPSYIKFGTTASGSVSRLERMRIDSKGNVGIGVTDPTFAMGFSPDIRNFAIGGAGTESAASAGSIEIANNRPTSTVGDYLGNLDFISVNNGAANRKLGARIQSQLVGAGGANGFGADLMFYTKPDNVTFTTTHERMRITSSGRLLVGSTESYQLDGAITTRAQVHGTSATDGSLALAAWVNNGASPGSLVLSKSRSGVIGTQTIVQNGDALGGIYFNGDDGTGFIRAGVIESQVDGVPGVGDMPGRIVFKTTPDGSGTPAEIMRITAAGNVGIGTTSPSYKLHVVGTAGLSTGTAWTNASDARLKDIQGDYEYGLNEILKLHTVRYNYKKDNPLGLPSDFNKTGFIAQEVREVIPDAVTERKDGYLELNVDPIHWAVVNAIKELYNKFIAGEKEAAAQSRELASVKAEVLAKDQKIQKLEQENAAIKSYLCSKDPNAPICP